MADAAGAEDAIVTFHVKSSGGQKYTVTLPLSTTTADLKNKLATEEYANVPASAQRLIYSGKVLKDHETLASHNVKEGNTMHLVKSAASNQRQNPAAQASSPSSAPSGVGGAPQATGVPQNLASGTGNDPLAGLTGARYAGFAQLPSASMFQNALSPEDFLRELENPNFQQMMREAMNNPQVQDMIINQNPHLRAMGPQARQMLQSDYFRRMMTDPQSLRSMMQMQQAMGMGPFGGGGGGEGAFPAPGVTNTTETRDSPTGANTQPGAQMPGQNDQQQMMAALRSLSQLGQTARNSQGQNPSNQANPFAALGGDMGANPFASLFAPPAQNPNLTTTTQPTQNASDTDTRNNTSSPNTQDQQQQQNQNPFAALFNPALFGNQGGGNGIPSPPPFNPFMPQNNPLLQNPEALNQLMQALGGGGAGNEATNYGNLLDMFGGGRPTSPPDNRPPEERYAHQLQQLNDMGFYDFDRNIQALRRTGGSVNGAIEYLLSNPQ